MCRRAVAHNNLPVAVVRAGNLGFSTTTGAWNTADFVCCMVAGCLVLGQYPSDTTWRLDLTPVDYAAFGFVAMLPQDAVGKVVHAQTPAQPIAATRLLKWVAAAAGGHGVTVVPVTLDAWRQRLAATVSGIASGDAVEGVPEVTDEAAQRLLLQLDGGLDAFAAYLSTPYVAVTVAVTVAAAVVIAVTVAVDVAVCD